MLEKRHGVQRYKGMEKPTKKFHKLETELMNALVDREESEMRKRYVKSWIYGEKVSSKLPTKKRSTQNQTS